MGRAARTALPTDQGRGAARPSGTAAGNRARPSPGAPAPAAVPEHPEAAAPCAGVPPLRLAPTGGGTEVACAEMTGGTGKSSRSRTECRARNVAQHTLLRLMRKEIRVTGRGTGVRSMDPHPWTAPGLTPVGYGAAPSPTAAEHTKPPTAFTCSSGGHRMRTRRRTAFRVKRNGARPFTSGRNPVVTSCDGPHTLWWGRLRMQQVGERCCVSMCPGWTFRGCGWPRGRTHCGKPFSVFTGSGTGVLRRCSGNGVRNPGRG